MLHSQFTATSTKANVTVDTSIYVHRFISNSISSDNTLYGRDEMTIYHAVDLLGSETHKYDISISEICRT